MIGFLRGLPAGQDGGALLLDVAGVGYRVRLPSRDLGGLLGPGAVNKEVFLHIHTHVREDSLELFGFLDRQDLVMYRMLTTVQNVGPAVALSLVSGFPAAELAGAITGGEPARLATVPRVGKKTAERIVLELREKVAKVFQQEATATLSGPVSDVVSALVNLGYKEKDAQKTVDQALQNGAEREFSALLKACLSKLGR